MRRLLGRRVVAKLLKQHRGNVKLNIGCGTDYKAGWINIDNNSDHNIDKLDLNWDLRKPLPFPDQSVDFIFNEHLLEHLTVEEATTVVKDLMRVLKPGGVMRIAVPDLAVVVNSYLHRDLKDEPEIKRFGLDFVKTKAEWVNMAFRWWGHQWLYDWDELKRRLQEAGCSKIIRCELNRSRHEELMDLETRGESLAVEVTK